MGVKSIRPTWFRGTQPFPKDLQQDSAQGPPEPMHGLRLMIKEEALPLREQPDFSSLDRTRKTRIARPRNMALQQSTSEPQNLN